jgi:hypothetical protein
MIPPTAAELADRVDAVHDSDTHRAAWQAIMAARWDLAIGEADFERLQARLTYHRQSWSSQTGAFR